MASRILGLPEELLCNIAHFLEKDDVCSLRLTCKQFQPAAAQALFSFIRLYPSEDSIERYNKILEHADFNKYVRHVELNTLDDDTDEEECSGEAELTDECLQALHSFSKFTGLTSTALRFSENATSGNSWKGMGHFMGWTEWPQTYTFRQPIVQKFFKTLARSSASKIKDICIDNIQNMNDEKFMQSEPALKVLSNLTALRLYIATEDHEAAPECNIEMEELHEFMAELRPLWLQPASNNLTTLVLYQSFYFGYCPKLDLRGLHLPNLRTLALGNYVFTHDWQMEWLSSHAGTLQSLYLDDCIVVFYARLLDCGVDSEHYPIIKTQRNRGTQRLVGEQFVFYDQTWSRILHHLRSNLSSLTHFRMGKSTRWRCSSRDPLNRFSYEDLKIGIFRDRYMMFNMGIGPCQYTGDVTRARGMPVDQLLDEDEGQGTPDGDRARAFLARLDEQDKEDAEELRKLLEKIGQPVSEIAQ